jgi:hypothetical protein
MLRDFRRAISSFVIPPGIISWLAITLLLGCTSPTDSSEKMRPQSVVLLVTPKIIPDFDHPEAAIAQFFDHYRSLTSRSAETIVIFAVGNSDHILGYRGSDYWDDNIEWARTTDFVPISDATLNYHQLDGIVRAFRSAALTAHVNLKVFDHIDSGSEFTVSNNFKYIRHPECTANQWGMFDIRGRMQEDDTVYATAPLGITSGTLCGNFLADQVSQYMRDVGFDGIMFDNQLGTRGRWHEGDGPGYSVEEEAAIRDFLRYSDSTFAGKSLMWFDSYNNVQVERNTFSFPSDGYAYFDYLIASGFCVTEKTRPYTDNLESKLTINSRPRILATLDYVDPWYSYNSMTDYAGCSSQLEQTAIDHRYQIDGVMFFANDEKGGLVPKRLVDAFASRFFTE